MKLVKRALAATALILPFGLGDAEAGMTWNAYAGIRAKGTPTLTFVLEKAGKPDLTRESVLGDKIFLYYLRGEGRSEERPTTVTIDGSTDRVIGIERQK